MQRFLSKPISTSSSMAGSFCFQITSSLPFKIRLPLELSTFLYIHIDIKAQINENKPRLWIFKEQSKLRCKHRCIKIRAEGKTCCLSVRVIVLHAKITVKYNSDRTYTTRGKIDRLDHKTQIWNHSTLGVTSQGTVRKAINLLQNIANLLYKYSSILKHQVLVR